MTTINLVLYFLAVLTSGACMVLLFRSYASSGIRLLLWSGLCFVALTINNVLLFLDLVILPDLDLRPYRLTANLIAVLLLLYAFIWETE